MSQSPSTVTSAHTYRCMSSGKHWLGSFKGSIERKDNITPTRICFQGTSPSPLPGSVSWLLVMLRNWFQHLRKIIQISHYLRNVFVSSVLLSPASSSLTVWPLLFTSPQFPPYSGRTNTLHSGHIHNCQGEATSWLSDELFSVYAKWQCLSDCCLHGALTHSYQRTWL